MQIPIKAYARFQVSMVTECLDSTRDEVMAGCSGSITSVAKGKYFGFSFIESSANGIIIRLKNERGNF